MSDVQRAVTEILEGRVPSAGDLRAAAPLLLDVLCGQDKQSVCKYHEALTGAVITLAGHEQTAVAARAIAAFSYYTSSANLLRGSATKSQEAAGVLTAALERFTANKEWSAVRTAVKAVWSIFRDTQRAPPELLKAAAHAIWQRTVEREDVPGDPDALWKDVYFLAILDVHRICHDELCLVWCRTVQYMAEYHSAPHPGDVQHLRLSVETLVDPPRATDQPAISHTAARAANVHTLAIVGLGATKALLVRYGSEVARHLLSIFWEMTAGMDDEKFVYLVTFNDGWLQKLQEFANTQAGWSRVTGKTAQERIQRLGKTWSVRASVADAAEGRANKAGDRANKAEDRANKAEDRANKAEGGANEAEDRAGKAGDRAGKAEDRADKAEDRANKAEDRAAVAEAQFARLNESMQQNLRRLLELQDPGHTVSDGAAGASVATGSTRTYEKRLVVDLEAGATTKLVQAAPGDEAAVWAAPGGEASPAGEAAPGVKAASPGATAVQGAAGHPFYHGH